MRAFVCRRAGTGAAWQALAAKPCFYHPGGRELRPSYPKPGAASRLGVVPLPDGGTYSHFPHHQVSFFFFLFMSSFLLNVAV